MDIVLPESRLARVFGSDSRGNSPSERALTSTREFVRSQDHLAVTTPEATGHRLTAWEAYQAFGFDKLEEVFEYGSAVLVADAREPAATIRQRRETLELELKEVAHFTGLTKTQIEEAESPNRRTSIRRLEQIALALGLDESQLTAKAGADGDEHLALRLRQMKHSRSDFSPTVVLKFGEAAWVIRKQAVLSEWLFGVQSLGRFGFEPDSRYGDHRYKAWQFGYDLAHTARKLLGYTEQQPIYLRNLVEKTLRIPLVHMELPKQIAGATIACGHTRGIVVNTIGSNANVWVSRATIAHELGHLFWDPDQRLKSLLVDTFNDLEEPPQFKHDAVEARANAFAIEFLAPLAQALILYQKHTDSRAGLRAVMEHFGISFTSARFQIWNALERRVPLESFAVDDVDPTDEWKGQESFTMDYFKPESTPKSRLGLFAGLVVKAMRKRLISLDTAALFLGCTENELNENAAFIEQIFEIGH